MRQWDYRKIDLNDLPRRSVDIDLLNAAGENGWQIVTDGRRPGNPSPSARRLSATPVSSCAWQRPSRRGTAKAPPGTPSRLPRTLNRFEVLRLAPLPALVPSAAA